MEAWRNGGKSASEGTGTTGAAVSSGSSVAEKLAKSMEAEHERVVAQLLEEQELARRKISEVCRFLFLVFAYFITSCCWNSGCT